MFRRGNDSIPGSARRFPLNPPESAKGPVAAVGDLGTVMPDLVPQVALRMADKRSAD